MDLFSALTDDQLAIVGCFVALGLCGAVAGLSFHLGPAGREQRRISRPESHPLPQQDVIPQPAQERRAA